MVEESHIVRFAAGKQTLKVVPWPGSGRQFEIFQMMTQLFLKPSIPGPLPLHMGEILAAVGAAIRLTLQEDELPVADLVLFVSINTSFCEDLFYQRFNTAQGISVRGANR